jgi:hypothetical protein
MADLWFRQEQAPQLVLLGLGVAQIERAADRYDAVGRPAAARALRDLAARGRFMSLPQLRDRYRELVELLESLEGGPAYVARSRRVPAADLRGAGDPYVPASDLCVIVPFFNPCHSAWRRDNFTTLAQTLNSSGVEWRAIECVFGNRQPELPEDGHVRGIRSESVLWQKERLVNAALRDLPDQFTKIAWIDGDVVFSNSRWICDTSDALETLAVVQPFETAVRLPANASRLPPDEDHVGEVSFAAMFRERTGTVEGHDYWAHGHTGFAWAARREWLEHTGLYEACLSGTGDHLMAHSFVGTWECPCMFERMRPGPRWQHYSSWSRDVYRLIRSRVGSVPGTVMSMWHGKETVRNDGYYRADHRLDDLGFDPYRDVAPHASGALEWVSAKPLLRQWALDYFQMRDVTSA